jgi:hypothetical protein
MMPQSQNACEITHLISAMAGRRDLAVKARPECLHLGLLLALQAQPLVPPPDVLIVPPPPPPPTPLTSGALLHHLSSSTPPRAQPLPAAKHALLSASRCLIVPGEVLLQLGRLGPQVQRALARPQHGETRQGRTHRYVRHRGMAGALEMVRFLRGVDGCRSSTVTTHPQTCDPRPAYRWPCDTTEDPDLELSTRPGPAETGQRVTV